MARQTGNRNAAPPPTQIEDLNLLMEEYASKLEEEIARESRAFKQMADAVPQIVWTSRPDGKPDYFNRRWYEYTGLSESKSLKSATLGVTHPDDIPKVQKTWRSSLRSGRPYQCEFRLKDNTTGQYRWFLGRAVPGRNSEGEIIKWYGTLTDIDDYRKSQEKKDEFIAIASHELKTPVTAIKAFTQLLSRRMKRVGDDASVAHIEKMDNQIDRLSGLVKELLDISLLDSGKLQLNKKDVDIDEFITGVIKDLQLLSDKHKLKVIGKTRKQAAIDKDRVEQVLINLVSNAIKYSPKADKVIIHVTNEKRTIKIGIQDFGMGIPKKEQKRIFERFFRVSGPKLETFSGLGLGLYISSEIIKKHRGRIWAESQLGYGSIISFTLPANK